MKKAVLFTILLSLILTLFTGCEADAFLTSEEGTAFLHKLGTLELRQNFVNGVFESEEEEASFTELLEALIPPEYDLDENPDILNTPMEKLNAIDETVATEEEMNDTIAAVFSVYSDLLSVYHEAIDEAEKQTFGKVLSLEEGGIDWRTVPEEPLFDASLLDTLFANFMGSSFETDYDYGILFALNSNEVLIYGETYEIEAPPVVVGGRTMVPMRFIAELFGMDVAWNQATSTLTMTNEYDKSIVMTIGSKLAYVNGDEVVLDAPPVVIAGRTMVPLRFIAETFGLDVEWDAENQTIFLY